MLQSLFLDIVVVFFGAVLRRYVLNTVVLCGFAFLLLIVGMIFKNYFKSQCF